MNAGLAVQYAVIGLAVAASAAYVVRKYWPRSRARAGAASCGSDDGGCSTCGACATSASPPPVEAMPLAPPVRRVRADDHSASV